MKELNIVRVKSEELLTGQNPVIGGQVMFQRFLEVSRVKSQKILISEDTILLIAMGCANYSWKQYLVGTLRYRDIHTIL